MEYGSKTIIPKPHFRLRQLYNRSTEKRLISKPNSGKIDSDLQMSDVLIVCGVLYHVEVCVH